MDHWTRAEARGALLLVALLALVAGWSGSRLREAPPARPPAPATQGPSAAGAVDLNRADARALDALPGIGPVLAERIVAHRARHGDFESADDLAAVRGIGPRLIDRLRDRVRIVVRSDSLLR